MSYKNALAGLDHGGGKAVILGDPRTDKTEALLEAYGRVVESLGGRYVHRLRRRAPTSPTWTSSPGPAGYVTGRSDEQRRQRRLVGAHRARRLLRHAGLRPAPLGLRRPDRTPGRGLRGRQGRAPTGRPTSAEAGASVVVYDVRRRGRRPPCSPAHPDVEVAASEAELTHSRRHRHLLPQRPGRRAERRDRRRPDRRRRLRRRQQPAGAPRRRAAAGRPGDHLRPRLPGQCRRRHPGRRRAERLRRSTGPATRALGIYRHTLDVLALPPPRGSPRPRPPTGWPRRSDGRGPTGHRLIPRGVLAPDRTRSRCAWLHAAADGSSTLEGSAVAPGAPSDRHAYWGRCPNEGVSPWVAGGPRPSRPRSPGS